MVKKLLCFLLLFHGTSHAYDQLLTWTAPGDDGDIGTASEYDIRYSTDSMVLKNWVNAVQAVGEPLPKVSGTQEFYTLTGLPDPSISVVYIAAKVRDESFNWSGLSNIVSSKDTTPPALVLDLRNIP